MDEDITSKEAIRQNLQARLLDSVKQCQTHFGGRQEIATEGDLRVATLCTEWETVLTHGIKKQKSKIRTFGNSKIDSITGTALWSVVTPFLSEEEIERFNRLRNVNSDIGRGRAWLRAAINERTLENYLHTITSDLSRIRLLYEPHAFLLDQERASMLPVMAAGLGSILFSLTVDAEYLNTPLRTVEVPVIDPALRLASSSQKPNFANRINISQKETNEEDIVAVTNTKMKRKKNKKLEEVKTLEDLSTNHISPTSRYEHENKDDRRSLQHSRDSSPVLLDKRDRGSSLRSTPSINSLTSVGDEMMSNVPMFNAPLDFQLTSDTSTTIPMDPQLAIESTSMVLAVTAKELNQENQTVSQTYMSPEEMKEALKVLVRGKEEVEEIKRKLTVDLEAERSRSEMLEKELGKVKGDLHNFRDVQSQQHQALERENDLLREQLKRYVGMVQQLQQGEEHEKIVSKKLSEMAEMYGELMEFNDRLHKRVLAKDFIIVKLCQTLMLAGIDIPVSTDNLPPEALKPKKVLDVWIPSVIKRGRGPDAHHAYQIYVKLGQDEWNVYRRYAEFYEFHQQLSKGLAEIEEFPFPPKRAIGSKATQVVEERREKLQEYIRFVIDLCSRPNIKRKNGNIGKAILTEEITKEELFKVFPFFKDQSQTSTSPPLIKSPSYNGL